MPERNKGQSMYEAGRTHYDIKIKKLTEMVDDLPVGSYRWIMHTEKLEKAKLELGQLNRRESLLTKDGRSRLRQNIENFSDIINPEYLAKQLCMLEGSRKK
jgi:hypothetical protein